MIPNYLKYIFYISVMALVSIFAAFVKNAIEDYKNEAIEISLNEVQSQQNILAIEKQKNVIEQQHIAFKSSQKILEDSTKIEKRISKSNTVGEKLYIKYKIIDEINCRLINFDDNSICSN